MAHITAEALKKIKVLWKLVYSNLWSDRGKNISWKRSLVFFRFTSWSWSKTKKKKGFWHFLRKKWKSRFFGKLKNISSSNNILSCHSRLIVQTESHHSGRLGSTGCTRARCLRSPRQRKRHLRERLQVAESAQILLGRREHGHSHDKRHVALRLRILGQLGTSGDHSLDRSLLPNAL